MENTWEGNDTKRSEADMGEASTVALPQAKLIGLALDGRYLIERKLGEGGFGVVFLAADQKMVSRKVVVKVLHDDTAKNAWVVKKFKQEIEALTRVNHPGIVGVFDTGQTPEGHLYIIMQYINGVTLRSLITSDGMPFWRAAKIISQVGIALNAAHQVGILHRDLKPENIMIETLTDDDEHVKIIDFGVAKITDSVVSHSTVEAQTVGTHYYMSPEQLNAQPLTPASDVYSLGVIAYEMLTGKRPINPDSVFQLRELQRLGVRVKPSDLRPSLPRDAEPLILKALSFEPQDRHQRARVFSDALASALLGADDPARRQNLVSESVVPERFEADNRGRHSARSPSKTDEIRARHTARSLSRTDQTQARSPYNRPLIAVTVLLTLGLLAAGLWYALRPKAAPIASEKPVAVAPVGPEQSLTYWLTVQKMLNKKPLGNPIESAGDISFGNGWRFHFNIRPMQSGALYLINEGPGQNGAEEYNVLFPLPLPGNAPLDSRVTANETKRAGPYDFVNQTGVEKLWIIWSLSPVAELDSIFGDAVRNKKTPGVIANSDQIARLQFYLKKYDSDPPEVTPDKAKKLTLIKGRGEIIVDRVELSHEAY